MDRMENEMNTFDHGVESATTRDLLTTFEHKTPEIVFEWSDAETGARGWTVINSLRGDAAGGGTRMRAGLDRREVESLAKTMEVKFTVSGPAIGGAKSGIDFDPADPRRDEVLKRWFRAVAPLLKNYYGTGGDLNVDELADVIRSPRATVSGTRRKASLSVISSRRSANRSRRSASFEW